MTVTNHSFEEVLSEVTREYEDDNEPESTFYVERGTRLIYEVRFFEDFALVRPAHPGMSLHLERMDLITFNERFEEYLGEQQDVKDYLWGADVSNFEITKK